MARSLLFGMFSLVGCGGSTTESFEIGMIVPLR
jgi:hypothetical protein